MNVSLSSSESSAASLFNAPEAIMLLNRHGVVRFATPAIAEIYGYTPKEVHGRSVFRFLTPECADHVRVEWQQFLASGHPSHEFAAVVRARGGQRVAVSASIWRLPQSHTFLAVYHLHERIRDHLHAIYAITNTLTRTLGFEEMATTVLHALPELITCHTCTLYMLQPHNRVEARRWHDEQIEKWVSSAEKDQPEYPLNRLMRETGQPILIPDTSADARWEQPPGTRIIRSWIGVPLVHRGLYLGELTLDSPQAQAFDETDLELAQALASQLAVSLHHAHQLRAEQQRAKMLQVLSHLSQAISRLSLAEVLELVYEHISALIDVSGFFIGLYDRQTNTTHLAQLYDEGERRPDETHSADEGLVGLVLRTGESIIIHDTEKDPRIKHAMQIGKWPRSVLIVPLVTQNEVVGVLSVQSYTPNVYTSEAIALMEAVAGVVATAVHNARLHDQTVAQLHALEMLHQLSLDLADTQDPQAIARLVVSAALDLLQADEARLCLYPHPTWDAIQWTAQFGRDGEESAYTSQANPPPNALTMRVQEEGQPIWLPELHEHHEAYPHLVTDRPLCAAVLYPIARHGQVMAVLTLLFSEPQLFRASERRVIEMLSLQAASALTNAATTRTLTQRLHEVIALHELAQRTSAMDSRDEILRIAVETVREVLQCRSASAVLLEADGKTITLHAGAGLEEKYLGQVKFEWGEYVAGAVVAQGKAIYVPDTYADPSFRHIDPEIRALLSVPLTVHKRTIGALNIDADTEDAFTPEHERVLAIAGGQIAATIETLRLLEEARQRADELTTVNAQLEAQDELRRELLFQVSHDLRSPLQIIHGYAEIMKAGMLGSLTPNQQNVLDLILKRSRSIEQLAKDIIAARPIDYEMLNRQPLDLNELCRQAVADAQMIYPDAPVSFASELTADPLIVEADYHRLNRIFDNLIGNAVKFSPDGGTITLRTHLDENGQWAHVSVCDQGIGIPADKLPYIFERFYRGDRQFRKRFQGTGLGLYITQQIIEAHRGKIWVESQENVGSTFTFALPLVER